jgi:hypothetical protein
MDDVRSKKDGRKQNALALLLVSLLVNDMNFAIVILVTYVV